MTKFLILLSSVPQFVIKRLRELTNESLLHQCPFVRFFFQLNTSLRVPPQSSETVVVKLSIKNIFLMTITNFPFLLFLSRFLLIRFCACAVRSHKPLNLKSDSTLN